MSLPTYRQLFEAKRAWSSDKWDHYLDLYDRHLGPFRGRSPTYLEIGVQDGGSLVIARDYLGPGARIFGLDVDPACARMEREGVAERVLIGSQGDPVILAEALAAMGGAMDIVVDDGSHTQDHMVGTFLTLFPALRAPGCYVIEDTHTVFYPSHQDSGTGLNVYDYFKGLADKTTLDFMAGLSRRDRFRTPREERIGSLPQPNRFAPMLGGIHFYNSMIVIEKTAYKEPLRVRR